MRMIVDSRLETSGKLSEPRRHHPQEDIFLEADNILHFAEQGNVVLRLLGGVGVWFVAPSASKMGYSRTYNDIDFIGLRKQSHKIEKMFEVMGYKPREMFNKLQGDSRLMFTNSENGRRIDIFLDKFVMCHQFDLKDRLGLSHRTLAPSDLLLTKLQIVEINKKDILDVVALFADIPVSEKRNEIDRSRILSFTSSDWGIYKTISQNLTKTRQILPELVLPEDEARIISDKIADLLKAIEESPKSLGWKMRSKVGEKVKWYELPEPT
jgi:hypothetical protein